MSAFSQRRGIGGDGGNVGAVWRTASDDAGDEHEHHRDFCRLYALLSDRTHGAWRSHVALAKPDEGWQSALLALLTTVAAYLIMMLAPFPGIRQMAVFAATGLSASCLTVFSGIPGCAAVCRCGRFRRWG